MQKESHLRTQGEDGCLQEEERGLHTNRPCRHPDLEHPASRTAKNKWLLFQCPACGTLFWQSEQTHTACALGSPGKASAAARAAECGEWGWGEPIGGSLPHTSRAEGWGGPGQVVDPTPSRSRGMPKEVGQRPTEMRSQETLAAPRTPKPPAKAGD